jgi:hypothetical protein
VFSKSAVIEVVLSPEIGITELYNNPHYNKLRANLYKDITNLSRTNLPEYMCPSVIKFVDSFEVNENGKIDFSKLPAVIANSASHLFSAPKNHIDEIICVIWQSVLGS